MNFTVILKQNLSKKLNIPFYKRGALQRKMGIAASEPKDKFNPGL